MFVLRLQGGHAVSSQVGNLSTSASMAVRWVLPLVTGLSDLVSSAPDFPGIDQCHHSIHGQAVSRGVAEVFFPFGLPDRCNWDFGKAQCLDSHIAR